MGTKIDSWSNWALLLILPPSRDTTEEQTMINERIYEIPDHKHNNPQTSINIITSNNDDLELSLVHEKKQISDMIKRYVLYISNIYTIVSYN